MTNDEIIEYGSKHEDETVRELARRFKEYRDLAFKYAGRRTGNAMDYMQDTRYEERP